MDDKGYLPIQLIASFHRVSRMTQDYQLILTAIQTSVCLELTEDCKCVRTSMEPTKWPILDSSSPPPPHPQNSRHAVGSSSSPLPQSSHLPNNVTAASSTPTSNIHEDNTTTRVSA